MGSIVETSSQRMQKAARNLVANLKAVLLNDCGGAAHSRRSRDIENQRLDRSDHGSVIPPEKQKGGATAKTVEPPFFLRNFIWLKFLQQK